ncbi:MAG: hypothetical protein AAGA65_00470 [Actinomycetota bacterium]
MKRFTWPFSAMTKALLFALLLLFAAACGSDSATTESAAATDDDAMEDSSEAMDDENMDDAMEDGEHGDDHDDHGDGHDDHGHSEPLEVPDGMAVPTISVTAEADTTSGHNLFITLEDFEIAPESASLDAVDGEGHLHLYVDGKRQGRFYNTALYLDGLEPGEHEVMVEVSANNHAAYAVDGEPIRAMTTITVEAGEGDHDHSDGDLFESANPPELSLTVTEDPLSGHNLFVEVTNFEFAPENVGGDAVDGEGHLHLLIDGKKAGRLYGPWTHLSLDPGTHEIAVEVSGNDHVAYGTGGSPIMAMTTIDVEAKDDDHDHGDDQDDEHEHGDEHDHGDEDAAKEDAEDGHDHGDGHDHAHGGTGETLDIAAADADVVIEASLSDGDLTIDERRFQVDEGQTVGVIFTSDEADEIHVHGYDILADVGPGVTADLAFLADSPGTFEVEIEGTGRFLFEIQVS